MEPISYWTVRLGAAEASAARGAVAAGLLSQGPRTERLERELARLLGVPYVVLTTSGSAALYMAAAALGIGPGDEVILPNRTFVASAHAVLLAGGRVRLVDTRAEDTLVDESRLEGAVTSRTKAIMAVHLNGNAADMRAINALARRRGLKVIEDAAQAFYSRTPRGFLGTLSDAGCFSLGVTKLITTGQGGFVATRRRPLYEALRRLRTHGVRSTFDAPAYERFGFNLKFNDILASIGLAQLERLEAKRRAHVRLYRLYEEGLRGLPHVRLLPSDVDGGRLPLWIEAVASERARLMRFLDGRGIQTRPFLPDLDRSPHLGARSHDFPNSRRFSAHGLFLPSGPDLPLSGAERAIDAIRAAGRRLRPLSF